MLMLILDVYQQICIFSFVGKKVNLAINHPLHSV